MRIVHPSTSLLPPPPPPPSTETAIGFREGPLEKCSGEIQNQKFIQKKLTLSEKEFLQTENSPPSAFLMVRRAYLLT